MRKQKQYLNREDYGKREKNFLDLRGVRQFEEENRVKNIPRKVYC